MEWVSFAENVLFDLLHRAPELLIWTFSITLYCILVFTFYHFVARRDSFGFDPFQAEQEQHNLLLKMRGTLFGLVKYGVLFPLFVFIWFSVFSMLLFFLAKDLATAQILLISISFVSAIRVISYYNESLSKDVAKLIPFVLLGVVIVEPGFFSLELTLSRVYGFSQFLPDLPVYFLFLVLIEWVLRILLAAKHTFLGVSPAPEEKE